MELTNEPTWIVDPIDGTFNFVHGLVCYYLAPLCLFNKVLVLHISSS